MPCKQRTHTTQLNNHLIRNFHIQHVCCYESSLEISNRMSYSQSSVKPHYDHPRIMLKNKLQRIYGSSAPDHIKWEIYSQFSPSRNLIWFATVYIDDMNHGFASARTIGDAQDKAAYMAYNYLRLDWPF
ncbi:hypothetical protein BDR03DRAFT_963282 [Suillus americanus]|nr:hypothetical protein BDR03DRAFT_963282 [Suillus americanus]